MRITRFRDIPQFTRGASYSVDVSWGHLERCIADWSDPSEHVALDLDPDFQRAHVWTVGQQVAYVEYALRGGLSGCDVYFNCAGWMKTFSGPFVLVDGKQRITAVRAFLNNEMKVFGSFYRDFTDAMRLFGPRFRLWVNDLKTRAEVLTWYLEMNTGGTPHTQDEIDKVRAMLEEEKS